MIAIHDSNFGFHPRWIDYCKRKNIPYKLVNCYCSDLIEHLRNCDALFWHHYQGSTKDLIAAKPILFALEQAGIKVFPNFKSNWHFDDKLGQKYLLEAIEAPLVPTYVFYDKKAALDWASKTTFPKVFKLRGGASSANVKLVKSQSEAMKFIYKAFGKGFSNYDAWGSLKERWRKWRVGKSTYTDVFKGLVRFIYPPPFAKALGREVGYVYFQDFIPNNEFDVRIVIIGDRALGEKRFVRKNDFRASGSGIYSYEGIDVFTLKTAFDIFNKLSAQSLAFDFIYDKYNMPLIVEISYGFGTEGIGNVTGYWDKDLNWHKGKFDLYGWMVEEVLKNEKQ